MQRVADALVWHRNPQKRGEKEKGEKHIIKIKGQTAVLHAWKAMHVCVCVLIKQCGCRVTTASNMVKFLNPES